MAGNCVIGEQQQHQNISGNSGAVEARVWKESDSLVFAEYLQYLPRNFSAWYERAISNHFFLQKYEKCGWGVEFFLSLKSLQLERLFWIRTKLSKFCCLSFAAGGARMDVLV